jgi:hypothetical protein
MKRIVYTRADGGLTVVCPAPRFMAHFETEGEALTAVIEKSVRPGASDIRICEEADLPQDRAFRGAWERSGAGAAVGMVKARAIQKARIRAARDAKLEKMDTETKRLEGLVRLGRATEAELTAHEEDKQAYRDMPNGAEGADALCDAAATPEELAAVWPGGLSK